MKLTNNRYYFDFNATSPLTKSVQSWLSKGDFCFGNPSSIHSTGKAAKREINKAKKYILNDVYSLGPEYKLFFHSGATEAANTFLSSSCNYALKNGQKAHVFCSAVDHSSVVNQKEDVERAQMAFTLLEVDSNGMPQFNEWVRAIKESKAEIKILNFTWVNNETGIVWPLSLARKIKDDTGCFIHVDSVQSIGKLRDWQSLDSSLNAYTFSGHKFGALKGVGLSLLNNTYPFYPLMRGGGQQDALRSGTENVPGIISTRLAFEDLIENFDSESLEQAISFLRGKFHALKSKNLLFPGEKSTLNLTTINLLVKGPKADILMTAFDLAQMDVSSGSACASGTVLPSRVLVNMGIDEEDAKSALRFSFSPTMTLGEAEEFWDKIEKVISRFF